MAGPLAFAPLVLGALGGILGGSGKRAQAQSAWNAQRPFMERDSMRRAGGGSVGGGIASSYGIDSIFPRGALELLRTPAPIPTKAPSNAGGWRSIMGDVLSGAAGAFPAGDSIDMDVAARAAAGPLQGMPGAPTSGPSNWTPTAAVPGLGEDVIAALQPGSMYEDLIEYP